MPPLTPTDRRPPASGEAQPPARLSRRGFLQLAGTGAASLALSACVRPPAQKILPYSRQPEQMTLLRDLQCEYGQGYFFSKPVADEAILARIERENGRPQRSNVAAFGAA